MLLAGCGGEEANGDSSGETESKSPTSSKSDTNSSTLTDTTPPIVNLDKVALDDPQTIEKRTITVVGSVTEDTDLSEIQIHAGDSNIRLDREKVDNGQFQVSLKVDGGQRYRLVVTATDAAGNTNSAERDLGYIARPTTKIGSDRLVGVHYYSWWASGWHWNKGYDSTPVLGEYDSRDPAVIQQHFDWLRMAGVNWLNLSWYGQDGWTTETIDNHLLPTDGIEDFELSILYESKNLLTQKSGYRTDMDDPANREQFVSDIEYMATQYFDRDNYLHFDGRPVVYLYIGSGYVGDFGAVRTEIQDRTGVNPYFICSAPVKRWAPAKVRNLANFDAVSNYSAFYAARPDINEVIPDWAIQTYLQWLLYCEANDLDFIPGLSPGFDKTSFKSDDGQDLPILHRSPERFEKWLREVRGLQGSLNATLITSFNEWHEGTQIEPDTKTGTAPLKIVRKQLREADILRVNTDTIAKFELAFARTVEEHDVNPDRPKELSRRLAVSATHLALLDANGQVIKTWTIDGGLDDPAYIKGVYQYNENWGRRWFGGEENLSILGFAWENLRDAESMVLYASAQHALGSVDVTGGLEIGPKVERTIDSGPIQAYHFPLTKG